MLVQTIQSVFLRIPVNESPESVKILENEVGAESIRTYIVFMTNGDAPNKSIVCQLCSFVMDVSMHIVYGLNLCSVHSGCINY